MGNTLSLTTLLLIALSPLAGALLVGSEKGLSFVRELVGL